MDSRDVLKAMQGPEIPEKPSVTITLERGGKEDMIWLSQCVDPMFDMSIVCEGLATSIVIAAKYDATDPEKLLQEVINRLQNSVRFHGTINRQG